MKSIVRYQVPYVQSSHFISIHIKGSNILKIFKLCSISIFWLQCGKTKKFTLLWKNFVKAAYSVNLGGANKTLKHKLDAQTIMPNSKCSLFVKGSNKQKTAFFSKNENISISRKKSWNWVKPVKQYRQIRV